MNDPVRNLFQEEALAEALQRIERSRAVWTDRGGAYTLPGMSELIDAKIQASEARTDTKFAQLIGELRAINARLSHVETSTAGIKMTVIATGIGAVGIVIAVFAYGGQMFGVGLDADAVARQAVSGVRLETAAEVSALNARYDRLEADIAAVLQAVRSSSPE